MQKNRYFIIYKPYGVLSQFTAEDGNPGLGSVFSFPKGIYPVGRLDLDSEGLLILTDDKVLTDRLLNPKFNHRRTYLAQVEGEITSSAVEKLEKGVEINLKGKKYRTKKAKVRIIKSEPTLPERVPPIRFRKNVPTSWIELTLTEGKNRQVRKMTAAAGFPTLRLVRTSIEGITITGMTHSEQKELTKELVYKLLFGSKITIPDF